MKENLKKVMANSVIKNILKAHKIIGTDLCFYSDKIESRLNQKGITNMSLYRLKYGLTTSEETKLKFLRAVNFILKTRGVKAEYTIKDVEI